MRKEERLSAPLEVKIPSFFRCPISLDVMRSPVSLCTGVTYDRSSIQRWIESGNATCPATMQPLPSTDLIPNLTLQRLIRLWCTESTAVQSVAGSRISARRLAGDFVKEVFRSPDPVPALRKIAGFFSDDDVDEFEKNDLVNCSDCVAGIKSVMKRKKDDVEALEASSRVLAMVLESDSIEEGSKKKVVSEISSDFDPSLSALITVLQKSTEIESRTDAARILQSVLATSDSELRNFIADSPDLISELLRLIKSGGEKGSIDHSAIKIGVSCLCSISSVRKARSEMVRLGVVIGVASVLESETDSSVIQNALKIMEALVCCADGRAAMCEHNARAVKAVASKMMKAGKSGAESSVAVLWAVCIKCKDRRAVEILGGVEGGLTKLLLLMQSGCSVAARQMAADLIKVFRVNMKSCLAGYDSKTTHIMPF